MFIVYWALDGIHTSSQLHSPGSMKHGKGRVMKSFLQSLSLRVSCTSRKLLPHFRCCLSRRLYDNYPFTFSCTKSCNYTSWSSSRSWYSLLTLCLITVLIGKVYNEILWQLSWLSGLWQIALKFFQIALKLSHSSFMHLTHWHWLMSVISMKDDCQTFRLLCTFIRKYKISYTWDFHLNVSLTCSYINI